MSIHRLSAGSGYQYLLRHTASGDVQRLARSPLTAYYAASGYPPGRWHGSGLAGLGTSAPAARSVHDVEAPAPAASGSASGSTRPANGMAVSEEQMARLYGRGEDPVTARPLGARYLVHRSQDERIAARVARLPEAMAEADRAKAVADIESQERRRRTPSAVAGFDLTFTMAKSASVLWALAEPDVQARIAAAHHAAVNDVMAVLERDALFTRTGHAGVGQIRTRGAIAACFDHWDTRAGDPNLHTHVVLANKVQGEDGRWRTLDSRTLHHAAVALSELYDDLLADRLAAVAGVRWGKRDRGERRTPAFEIDGVDDEVLGEFSTRARHIDRRTRELVADHRARTGKTPDRPQVLRLRQQATLETRPEKTLRPLPDLIDEWRQRAETHGNVRQLVDRALNGSRPRLHTADAVSDARLRQLADETLVGLQERRSTWNRWNVLAEAARASRDMRMASPADRLALLDRVTQLVLGEHCVSLDPPALFQVPQQWRRPTGGSAFTRHNETAYTSPAILDAEQRLLAAANDHNAPRASAAAAPYPSVATLSAAPALHDDQLAAVTAIVTSGRRVDVLIGPAGAGKTRTLLAVRTAWVAHHGPGSVVGLAPSAAAAQELTAAVGIACETTAKWQHQTPDTGDTRGDRIGPSKLRGGQLVIVDEASLAGTLELDHVATQAAAVGAKVLLVGDHHQLAAVSAGGAFGLLARDTRAAELTLLWRFRNRWEADASRALRRGHPRGLDEYAARGRFQEGPTEAMVEEAFRAWRRAASGGANALLVAADNATVTALNARAQADLIAVGSVSGIGGVALHDESTAHVGDRIVTRRNDRRLTTAASSWVRNGDLWRVAEVHADGSVTAHRLGRSEATRLPAGYVRDHVELGYATTVHRAQGMTADMAFALVRPGMSREALYVALTRGRTANYGYIATDLPDANHHDPSAPERTGRQVLEAVLRHTAAEPSATETMRTRYDQATSLATLVPIYQTLAHAGERNLWTRRLRLAGMAPDMLDQIVNSPAYGALVAVLTVGEHNRHDMTRVLAKIAAETAATASDGNADAARELHERVTRWLEDAPNDHSHPRLVAGLLPAPVHVDDPELRRSLDEIENLMTQRVRTLTVDLLRHPPSWVRPLGPPPRDGKRRADWIHAVGVVAGYREIHQIGSDLVLGPRVEIDSDPSGMRRIATAAAAVASRLAHEPPRSSSVNNASLAATQRSLQR